tara:strand:+ start:75 stop:440 length:366 start_codon:yes stop_codon:yes gene_type:complete
MVVIQCPHCSLEVELDNEASGLFDCPHCGKKFEFDAVEHILENAILGRNRIQGSLERYQIIDMHGISFNRKCLLLSFLLMCIGGMGMGSGGGTIWVALLSLVVFLFTTSIEIRNLISWLSK